MPPVLYLGRRSLGMYVYLTLLTWADSGSHSMVSDPKYYRLYGRHQAPFALASHTRLGRWECDGSMPDCLSFERCSSRRGILSIFWDSVWALCQESFWMDKDLIAGSKNY
jgi:hypothetical protein